MLRAPIGFPVPCAFGTTIAARSDAAVEQVASLLVREGCGIVSDTDISRRLKAKAVVDVPRYRMVATHQPVVARRAMLADPGAAAIFPCNILARERRDRTRFDVADPNAALGLAQTTS
jgi:uncharacterized protein (DUF302 family)